MQDTAWTTARSVPQTFNPTLAPLLAVDTVVVGEVVPAFDPDEALLELLDDLLPAGAGAAVAAAPPLLTPALLNTPASTNFVHAPTTSAE